MAFTDSQVIIHDSFDDKGWLNENSLTQAYLTKPDEITPLVTFLKGNESDKFPLTFLSEGQKDGIMYSGGKGGKEISDIEFFWRTFGRIQNSDTIVHCDYTSLSTPGIGHGYFFTYFKNKILKRSHTIRSSDGTLARVMREPEKVGVNRYKYTLQLINPNPQAVCGLSQLVAGQKWVQSSPAVVSNSDSKGTEADTFLPGAKKGQVSVIRKSYTVAGNVSNRVVECKFKVDGKETSLFVEWDRWVFETKFRQECEEHLWLSEYNRKADGTIPLVDEDSGLPIPYSAGVFEQIPNKDTYSELTPRKIKNFVNNIFSSNVGYDGNQTIVLFTELGGFDDFDEAMKNSLQGWQVVGDKFVQPFQGGLMLTGHFKGYEDTYGNKIILKKLPLLLNGSMAENSPKHPRTGLPMTSHAFYGIDMTMQEGGENNLKMVYQKGRSMITGVEQGMSKLPGMNYNGNDKMIVSTDKDRSSVHYLGTKGIVIQNNTNCFSLECTLS